MRAACLGRRRRMVVASTSQRKGGIPLWMSFFRLKKNEGNDGVLGPETSSRVIVALPSSSAYNAGGDIRAASNRSPPFRPDVSSECRLIWPPIRNYPTNERTGRIRLSSRILSLLFHQFPGREKNWRKLERERFWGGERRPIKSVPPPFETM